MPPGKSHRGSRPKSSDINSNIDKRKNNQKVQQKSSFRKAHRDLNLTEKKDPIEDRRLQDEKLLKELSAIVDDYSQQRMRALHMSLRQNGNDEGRITSKEMVQSLQLRICYKAVHEALNTDQTSPTMASGWSPTVVKPWSCMAALPSAIAAVTSFPFFILNSHFPMWYRTIVTRNAANDSWTAINPKCLAKAVRKKK